MAISGLRKRRDISQQTFNKVKDRRYLAPHPLEVSCLPTLPGITVPVDQNGGLTPAGKEHGSNRYLDLALQCYPVLFGPRLKCQTL